MISSYRNPYGSSMGYTGGLDGIEKVIYIKIIETTLFREGILQKINVSN
jgi:hypothetical protein